MNNVTSPSLLFPTHPSGTYQDVALSQVGLTVVEMKDSLSCWEGSLCTLRKYDGEPLFKKSLCKDIQLWLFGSVTVPTVVWASKGHVRTVLPAPLSQMCFCDSTLSSLNADGSDKGHLQVEATESTRLLGLFW